MHDRQAAHVRRICDRDDAWQAQRPEGAIQPRCSCLRRIAPAPVLVSQSPAHLDVVGVGPLVVQAAHPEERAIFAALDSQQAQSLLREALLRPLRDLVGMSSGQRDTTQKPHHLRVGVERREQRQVIAAERPQQ